MKKFLISLIIFIGINVNARFLVCPVTKVTPIKYAYPTTKVRRFYTDKCPQYTDCHRTSSGMLYFENNKFGNEYRVRYYLLRYECQTGQSGGVKSQTIKQKVEIEW